MLFYIKYNKKGSIDKVEKNYNLILFQLDFTLGRNERNNGKNIGSKRDK